MTDAATAVREFFWRRTREVIEGDKDTLTCKRRIEHYNLMQRTPKLGAHVVGEGE